jgi:glycosyltransferase involved in cell wall biosynthesis
MPTLGLSMIVKNGGEDLRQCLASVRGVVDQIVVADTGSTDATREIAMEAGATVISAPWTNDFAAARNAALEPVTTDWVLVLDADEELDESSRANLAELISRPEMGGYVLPIHNYLPVRFARMYNSVSQPNDGRSARAKDCPSFTEHLNCRLFRRHPAIIFEGQVHERVENNVLSLGLRIAKADVLIHHFGQLASAEERLRKHIFYRDLGRAKVEKFPGSAMAWMELGLQEYENFRNYEEAMRCFSRAVELDHNRFDAWTFLAMIHAELGNSHASLSALNNAGNSESGAALREHLRGDMLHNIGQLAQARAAYRRALKVDRNSPFLESKLGYTEVRMGMKQQGFNRMLRAVRSAPDVLELHERLMKAYLATNNEESAAAIADQMAERFPAPQAIKRAASIRAHLREWSKAVSLLESGLRMFPDSSELQIAYAQARQSAGY